MIPVAIRVVSAALGSGWLGGRSRASTAEMA